MLNAANSITLVRLLMFPIAVGTMLAESALATPLLTIIFLMDKLDGFIARKLDQVTKFGKVFDSIVDSVIYAGSLVVLGLLSVPMVLVASILSVALVNMVIQARMMKARGTILRTRLGVASGFVIALSIVVATVNVPIAIAMFLLALFLYIARIPEQLLRKQLSF